MPSEHVTPQARRDSLRKSLDLLETHQPDWKGPDRARGLATMDNLQRQIDVIDGRARR